MNSFYLVCRCTFAIAMLGVVGAATSAPPANFDDYMARAMSTSEAPGFSVAIVENGKTTLAKGYGIRKMGANAKVDDRTLFPIASNSKAFTATALAILVDEGKLSWDDKVSSRLPGFQMYDPYVTGEMNIRDLLVHRSGLGLGQGDLMVIPFTDFTAQEVVEHLRYLKPARGFREGYAYDNVLYSAAGVLIETVSGQTFEDFIRKRIFSPLGMKDSVPSFQALGRGSNRGWQHGRLDGAIRGTGTMKPFEFERPIGSAGVAAGGINASARDMAKWLAVQLGRGTTPDGKKLFSEAQATALWNPEVLIPTRPGSGALASAAAQFQSYALGFTVSDYRGHKLVQHGGGWFGGLSRVVFIPDKNVAFAVMTNSEEGGALTAVQLTLLDHYLDQPAKDWLTPIQEERKARIEKATAFLAAAATDAGKSGPPSLPLEQYAGVYRDPWYGTTTIRQTGKGMTIRFDRTPGMEGALEPVRFDTFRTRWSDPSTEDAYVSFTLKPDGSIDHFTMKAISPLADFSFDYHDLMFTPEPAAKRSTHSSLSGRELRS